MFRTPFAVGLLGLFATPLAAADPAEADARNYNPTIAEASDEGERALAGFRVPDGFTGSLWAAEPLLANPVAFSIDHLGRVYVAETFRQQRGVEDNRYHMDWLEADLAAESVDDRREYILKYIPEAAQTYTAEQDRIRLLTDSDGDGRADGATVFAGGFDDLLDGTGAGVLARPDGDVYYTCIPDLYRLRDGDGDGRADEVDSLATGFGVRFAFRGHDMHGLTMGPDGRLYWSIGDRGFNVVTPDGERLVLPYTGAVFRAEPDGSRMEVFATGLRNPQELAFDARGDLFTWDNNSDSGDKARWVHVVRGMDAGWRMFFQYEDDRGPWNRELMWYPRDTPAFETSEAEGMPLGVAVKEVQPAFILPPVANVGDGPSGLTYDPGVGLPAKYADHFFAADFRGTPADSGIRTWANEPAGAGFELVESEEFVWGVLATDVDFGPDARLYLSDWVSGWDGPGKGRIYRFESDAPAGSANSAEVFAGGFAGRDAGELVRLLAGPDRRVRLEAQYELADRGEAARLANVALSSADTVVRLHGVWGLGTIARRSDAADRDHTLKPLLSLLTDADPHVRRWAATMLAEAGATDAAAEAVENLLADPNPAVRRDAALAVGMFGRSEAGGAVVRLLRENDDADATLRHAGVMGLVGTHDADGLAALADDESPAVRLAAVVALRRIASPKIAEFLSDADPRVVAEAARAIDDAPVDDAAPALAAADPFAENAAVPAGSPLRDPFVRRFLNANYRLGGREHAARVARAAASAGTPALRLEALGELRTWAEPDVLDRVTGRYRPVDAGDDTRDVSFMPDVLGPHLDALFDGDGPVRVAAAELAGRYGLTAAAPRLERFAVDADADPKLRVAALASLETLAPERAADAATRALENGNGTVRSAAREVLVRLNPSGAVPQLAAALNEGETVERQRAVATLAGLADAEADAVLADWLGRMVRGPAAGEKSVPAELRLDLLEAARTRGTPELSALVEAHDAARDPADPLAGWRESLAGGDADAGRAIFFGRSDASCRRCHLVAGEGGAVGPDLTGIGAQKNREYLLEAIVRPNAKIAEGYETVVVVLDDGRVRSGVKRAVTEDALTLVLPTGEQIVIPTDQILDQSAGDSAMPQDIVKALTPRDMRDLVEYLASLRGGGGGEHGRGE